MPESIQIVEPEEATGKYSMVIGRFSPPHPGHMKLIKAILDEGGYVFIAIRDTKLSEKDPYTYEERKAIFQAFLVMENGSMQRVEIGKIPDIKEICFGRKVGWGVRQIRLDQKTEDISATEIRAKGDERCRDLL